MESYEFAINELMRGFGESRERGIVEYWIWQVGCARCVFQSSDVQSGIFRHVDKDVLSRPRKLGKLKGGHNVGKVKPFGIALLEFMRKKSQHLIRFQLKEG